MKRIIGLVLVLFMLGNMCAFADVDGSATVDESTYWIVGIAGGLLVALLVTLPIFLADAGKDPNAPVYVKYDPETGSKNAEAGQKFKNTSNAQKSTGMTVLEHVLFGATNGKVLIGASFKF